MHGNGKIVSVKSAKLTIHLQRTCKRKIIPTVSEESRNPSQIHMMRRPTPIKKLERRDYKETSIAVVRKTYIAMQITGD